MSNIIRRNLIATLSLLLQGIYKWFFGVLCVITNAKNAPAKDYNVLGDSKQEYITIDDVQYKIPDGYTLLDYIQSSGTQYIDTGYYPNNNTCVEFKYSDRTGDNGVMFGAYSNTGSWTETSFGLYQNLSIAQGQFYIHFCSNTKVGVTPLYSDGTIKLDKGVLYYNGTQIGSQSASAFTCPQTMYLFSGHGSSTQNQPVAMKTYYWKIFDNDVLVRNFVPAMRESDSEVGLYDFVNNVFYTNAGTGSFTAGNEAPCPDQPIDIVSCGDYVGQKNQLCNYYYGSASSTDRGITFTNNNNGSFSFSGTATDNVSFAFDGYRDLGIIEAHKYLVLFSNATLVNTTINVYDKNLPLTYCATTSETIFTASATGTSTAFYTIIRTGGSIAGTMYPMLFDLTKMFGAGNEPTTVADAKTKIAEVMGGEKDYYPYNAGTDYYKIPAINGANCGCIDLGSLTWTMPSSGKFTISISTIGAKANGGYNLLEGYTHSASLSADKTMAIGAVNLAIRNDSYTSLDLFKQAMSGVYLYYQRTDDTSFTQPTTTNIYLDEPLRGLNVTETPYALPSEYQQVEYLQSSGVQYINTDYAITSESVSVELAMMITGTLGSKNLWGSSVSNKKWFTAYSDSNALYMGSSSARIAGPSTTNTKYTLKYETSNNTVTQTIDGVQGTPVSYSGTIISGEKFCLWSVGDTQGSCPTATRICPNLRYYWFKITDNGNLVRNLIPCIRKSDSKPGMYDTVTQTFFTNANTSASTDFTYGSAIYSDYLDYKNQNVVNAIGVKTFDGTEAGTWTLEGNLVYKTVANMGISDCKLPASQTPTISKMTHFVPNIWSVVNTTTGTFAISYNGLFAINTTGIGTTDAAVDAWLATNKPTIYYPLATSTTTSATIPVLTTLEGTNTITTSTKVAPSNMQVQASMLKETAATIDSNGVVTATGSIDSSGVTTLNGTIDSNGVVSL